MAHCIHHSTAVTLPLIVTYALVTSGSDPATPPSFAAHFSSSTSEASCLIQGSSHLWRALGIGTAASSGATPAMFDIDKAAEMKPAALDDNESKKQQREKQERNSSKAEFPPLTGVEGGSVYHELSAAGGREEQELFQRNKVFLILLDIFPPSAMLGLDRMYLGSMWTGITKLLVCLCTCGLGGIVWGLVDGVAVASNCIRRQETIDVMDMHAQFGLGQIQLAEILGYIYVAMLMFFTGFAAHLFCSKLSLPKREPEF